MRARRIPCSDERIGGGEARRGDWLIENAQVRFAVRDPTTALTRLDAAGGTIVDAVAAAEPSDPTKATDALVELVPLFGGQPLTSARLRAWNQPDSAGVTVAGQQADGVVREVQYRLDADSPVLSIAGPGGATLVLAAGDEAVGQTIESPEAANRQTGTVYGLLGATSIQDAGGWVEVDGLTGLVAGDRQTVYAALWPDGIPVSGTADAEWIEAIDTSGATLARLPVVDGAFSGVVPPHASALVATAAGRADGDPVAPGEGLSLEAGAAGSLAVRVTDGDGNALPAVLWWAGREWPIDEGGSEVPVGPGTGTAVVSAGPAYEAAFVHDVQVSGRTELEVALDRVATGAVLADFDRTGWPDRTIRTPPADRLALASGEGLGFVVLVADDEVAAADLAGHTGTWLRAEAGSRAATDAAGTPVAWPWTAETDRAAHGAAPWQGLSAQDLLAVMDDDGGRFTLVDADWTAAAGPAPTWAPYPSALRLRDLDDLPTAEALWDGWQPVGVVGPLTWVEGVDDPREGGHYASVDIEHMLLRGRTVATNGPRIVLDVEGQGPGSALEPDGDVEVHLRVEAPGWMPLDQARLIGSGGAELGRWTLGAPAGPVRLDTTLTVPAGGWVAATCSGSQAVPPLLEQPAWAVTSPIWLGRP